MDASSVADLETILKVLKAVQVGKWTDAAGLALFLYDVTLTLDDEYRYIWKSKWSTGKILYVAVRYPFMILFSALAAYKNTAPNTVFNTGFCRRYEMAHMLGGLAQMTLIQSILGLRTIALHDKNLRVTAYVCCTGLFTIAALLALGAVQFRNVVFDKYTLGASFTGCRVDCVGSTCCTVWRMACLPILFFDAVMFLLTWQKHRQDAKRLVNMTSPLLRILYRDGFIHFATNFASVLAYFAMYNVRGSITLVTYPLLRTIMTISSARLLLGIRRAYLRSFGSDTILVSSCHFSGPSPDMDTTPTIGAWGILDDLSYSYVRDPAHTRNEQVETEISDT